MTDLTPGPDLDARVARAMGQTEDDWMWDLPRLHPDGTADMRRLPPAYSTDIREVGPMLEWLSKQTINGANIEPELSYQIGVDEYWNPASWWNLCHLAMPDDEHPEWFEASENSPLTSERNYKGDTQMLAACAAVLAVSEREEDGGKRA